MTKICKYIYPTLQCPQPSAMPGFGVRWTNIRLAAGLCPDPMGELTSLPQMIWIWRGDRGKGRIGRGKIGKRERWARGRGGL